MSLEQARQLLARYSPLPSLVVMDLDYTMWPFWCECFSEKDEPWLYPHVPAILQALEEANIPMAIASRTPTPKVASAFLHKLGLHTRFASLQLIPALDGLDHTTAQKDVAHLPAIKAETAVEYSHMVFFDDERKNVEKVSRLGVPSHLVSSQRGLDLTAFEEGLKRYQEHHQR